MRKKFGIMLIFLLLLTTAFQISIAKEYIYPDLTWTEKDKYGRVTEHEHFAVREITKATKIGFIDGYEDGTFKPNETITREEFIKMLIVLATNRTFDFSSVDTKYSTWAGPYITIAEMQGIIDKNAYTEDELKEPITRLETVLMLSKTQIKMKGIPQNQIGHLVYTDIDNLTEEERDLILHAVKYDLLEGMKDGTNKLFEPNKYLTRGEAAAALMRVY